MSIHVMVGIFVIFAQLLNEFCRQIFQKAEEPVVGSLRSRERGGKRVKVCVTRMKAERDRERGQYATVTRLN